MQNIPDSSHCLGHIVAAKKFFIKRRDQYGECTEALKDYCNKDKNTKLFIMPYNLGHGLGLDFGLRQVETSYAYTFESDTLMKRSGLIEAMLELADPDIYSIGRTERANYPIGGLVISGKKTMRILWAYALLIYPPWDSNNGTNTTPVLKAMKEIADTGRDNKLMIEFDVDKYVEHLFGRTRARIGNPKIFPYIAHEDDFEKTSNLLKRVSVYEFGSK